MADLAEIERMIADALPGAEVEVIDETGGGDHLRAIVRAPQFEGKSRIDQPRLVGGKEPDRPAPWGWGGRAGANGRRLDSRALDPDGAGLTGRQAQVAKVDP